MVTPHQVVTFGIVAFVLIAIPGPSVVFTVGRALAYGRAVALLTVAGNSLGLLVVLLLVAFGLGDVVARSDAVFELLKYAGAAVLVWLGVQAIRHRHGIEITDRDAGPSREKPDLAGRVVLRQGFVVGLTNSKAYVMFAAVLPSFVDRDRGHPVLQLLVLGLIAFVIGICSDTLWALLASQLRRWFNASPTRGRALGVVGGVSMIGLGAAVALGGRPDSA